MPKKALAILSSSKTLVDFLWYYTEYGQEFEWDVLIHKNFILSQNYLQKTGIFKNIYLDETNLLAKNKIALAGMFAEMVFYKIIGHQERYAEKTLKKLTEGKIYDLYVVAPYLSTVLPGLVYLMGKEHEVVILEDGNGDYLSRPNRWIKTNPHNLMYFASYVLGKMGYADLTNQYDLKSYKNCIKCSSFPEKMEYNGYKKMLKIGLFTENNRSIYDDLVSKTFLLNIDCQAAAVLYTVPISDFTDDQELIFKQVSKTEQYINKYCKGKTILIKKHPRDKTEYQFDSDVQTVIIDPVIPGEMVADQLKRQGNPKSIFMFTSTMIQHLDHSDYIVLYYTDLENKELKAPYTENFSIGLEKSAINKENVVAL